jgi:predicted ABC-type ATPase
MMDLPSTAYHPLHPSGVDTLHQFSDGKGHFTKERVALHDEIISKFLSTATEVANPEALILGGGPGTGKSTLVSLEGLHKPNTLLINTDDIRALLPELKEGKPAFFSHEEASHIGKQLRIAAGKRNILLDGTGDSSLENLGGKVAMMRASGHSIVAEYVNAPTEVALERAQQRAARTGRQVPVTVLRETHAAVSRVFPEAVRQGLFDKARLWDVSGPKGSKPTLVVSSIGKKMTIHNEKLWQEFLAKGHEK